MINPQKKIETLKDRIREARISEENTEKDAAKSPGANLFLLFLAVIFKIIIFYYTLNLVLDKFKIAPFSLLECVLIFYTIGIFIRPVSKK